MTPRVSVVVPAYNNAEYIEATLESVLAQTYTDFELVVSDHASTDDTWERLQRFAADPRVRLLTTPAGGGARANWDRVSKEATGELLKLVCGDDLLYPTMLERQVEALDAAGEGTLVVTSSRDLVDGRGKVFLRARGLQGLSGRMSGRAALRAVVRSGSNPLGEPACVMFRRAALEAVGWWDDTYPYYIDAGTYAQVLLRGDLTVVDEPLAAFRVSASQWSVRLMRQQLEQAEGFHRRVHTLAPESVTPADVRRGNVLARVAAAQRRLAYAWLGSRMHPEKASAPAS
ncbi:glycosyltransferase family A protein [Cellulomonas cellasea]|uniref:Glycosyltransferase involved in cell wall biosynthesis n=1 Tax=Cellulomonas cellasea TaxID=43670 RepID=A0A7W4UEU8_9CELL|nr:glycosyltransferase family A protein [Cellulomonas cellasea]MBB2922889.1 glycosyltransferase involved in cell wall biosynthesis [Cellulomonas cellasea]